MNKTPIIIDCDPGHDDAIALLVALASDKFDLRGITTVAGNQTLAKTTLNALKVLELCKRTEVKVVPGRSNPFMNEVEVAKHVHGESGMDGPVLPIPTTQPYPMSAVEFIADEVEKCPTKMTLVAVGPFTNIATFLLAYPHLHSKIEKIHVMGGGIYEGNRTHLAEFNVWSDPEAAKVITNSKIPVHFFGLDVTYRAVILKEEFEIFRNEKGPVFQFVADLLEFFVIYHIAQRGVSGCPMHDSCAVAGLIDLSMFVGEEAFIDVELDGKTRGACVVDLRPVGRRVDANNGFFYYDLDRPRFLQLIIDSCRKLESDIKAKEQA